MRRSEVAGVADVPESEPVVSRNRGPVNDAPRDARAAKRRGGWTPGSIADELNRTGVPKGRANRMVGGTRWREDSVRSMLGSEEYRGVFITNRYRLVQKKPRKHEERPREEWIVVRMPAIIDDVLYCMAQERLVECSRKPRGGGGNRPFRRTQHRQRGRQLVGSAAEGGFLWPENV
jgi:hypothetical protein